MDECIGGTGGIICVNRFVFDAAQIILNLLFDGYA